MEDILRIESSAFDDCIRDLTNLSAELENCRNELSPVRITLENLPNFVCMIAFSRFNPFFALISLIHTNPATANTLYSALTVARSNIKGMMNSIDELNRRVQRVSVGFDEMENKMVYEGRGWLGEDPFDGDGTLPGNQNGGNQGNPRGHTAQYGLYEDLISKNNGRTFADQNELVAYLDELNNGGCSYVAMCNAIFEAYRGRESEFEATFGYPMYDTNGDFNFDALTVDIYSFANINRGTQSLEEQADIISRFCQQHSTDEHPIQVQTTINHEPLTAETYRQMEADGLVSNGEVSISTGYPLSLRDMDGNPAPYPWDLDGGHTMTIVGTKGDYLVVSSWGRTYLLDPADNGRPETGGHLTIEISI